MHGLAVIYSLLIRLYAWLKNRNYPSVYFRLLLSQPAGRFKTCALHTMVSLLGISREEFHTLSERLLKQEDMLGTAQPRITSVEFRSVALDSRVSDLEARMDQLQSSRLGRVKQRALLLEDQDEPQGAHIAPTAPAQSHRGEGALPAPVPAKGFSQGQIVALATPPGSVSITAPMADGAPLFIDPMLADDENKDAIACLPKDLYNDVLDTIATIDHDMITFRHGHTKHYDMNNNLNKRLEYLSTLVLDIQARLAAEHLGERLDVLEGKTTSLANVVEASQLSMWLMPPRSS